MNELWTKRERDILRQMIGAECSLKDIAMVLKGRTEPAIRSQMRAQGLKVQGSREIDYEAFRRLMKQKGKVIECG